MGTFPADTQAVTMPLLPGERLGRLFFPLIFAFVFILLSLFVMISTIIVIAYVDLRAPVRKNQTYRGKGGKFDFFHILMSDRLGYN